MTKPTPLSHQVFSRRQSILFYATIVFITVASFALGYLTRELLTTRNAQFPLLSEAYGFYREYYFDNLPSPEKIEYGTIRGMLTAGADPFTTFLEPPQNELQTNQLQGKFGGIGVRIDRDSDGNTLLYPISNSPAKNAGVLDGDRLLVVDTLLLKPETDLDTIQAAIRGPVNSIVTIKIGRGSEVNVLEFKLLRAEVTAPSVTFNIAPTSPQVGVIQANIIAASTADEIVKAITQLKSLGASHFVLDLRNNGGGLVEGGVNTASLFLQKDLTLIEEQFRGQPIKTFKTNRAGQFLDIPLVILVNKNTASSAEILAGALQYHQRARLIGSKTFGKDSVQMIFDLSDGSSLHITAGKWWLPEQRNELGGHGLTPDYEFSPEEAASPSLMALAIKLLAP